MPLNFFYAKKVAEGQVLSKLEDYLNLFFLEHQERLITDFIILRNLEEYGKVYFKFILEQSLGGREERFYSKKFFSWPREYVITKGLFSNVE